MQITNGTLYTVGSINNIGINKQTLTEHNKKNYEQNSLSQIAASVIV